MEKINLLNFRSNGSKIFSGRDKGIDARKKLKLNELDSQEQKIEVIVPKDTWSINSSFFGGLFESSIINLKEDVEKNIYLNLMMELPCLRNCNIILMKEFMNL